MATPPDDETLKKLWPKGDDKFEGFAKWGERDRANREDYKRYMETLEGKQDRGKDWFITQYEGEFKFYDNEKHGKHDRYPPRDDIADAMSYMRDDFDRMRQSNQAKRKLMSNKFLPFIVESSTPLNIWTTVLSRSKGMEAGLTVSMFNLVLNYGVKKLRDEAKQLPEMGTTELYAKLMEMHPKYRVDDEQLRIFAGMSLYCSTELFQEHIDAAVTSDLTPEQVFQFMLPLTQNDLPLSEYTALPLQKAADMEHIFAFVKDHILFNDAGQEVTFKNADAFKSWCLYMIVLSDMDEARKDDLKTTYKVRFK